jgi:hypothetical protein
MGLSSSAPFIDKCRAMNLRIHLPEILLIGCISTRCTTPTESREPEGSNDYSLYAGSVACKNCHEELFKRHQQTPHHLTSQLADTTNILGSFEQGRNVFFYSAELFVVMGKSHERFSQTVYYRDEKITSKSIDLVFGSGVRGQTYLNWSDSTLYQLPIGYFTKHNTWANSPGFSNRPIFNRPITSRCLECHSTYFNKMSPQKNPERFSKNKFILGIECEKCHGPGLRHANFHQQNKQEKGGKFITSFKKFSRKQHLDFCRSCHGGKLPPKKPAFTFKAGDELGKYFQVDTLQVPAAELDSHGNQYGMLSQSKCFLQSDMTCLTCHQVHQKEKGNVIEFSKRCMTCHSVSTASFCKTKALPPSLLKQNCIQCHMPEKNSNSVRMLVQGEDTPVPAKMHVHRITVDQDEVIKYIKSLPLSKN